MKWQKIVFILLLAVGVSSTSVGAVLPGLTMNQVRSQTSQETVRQTVDLVTELFAFRLNQIAKGLPQTEAYAEATARIYQYIATLERVLPYGEPTPGDINAPEVRARLAANLRLENDPALTAEPPKRLRHLALETPMHATSVDGLCGYIQVSPNLLPIGGAQGPDAPVKPNAVYVLEHYVFIKSPVAATVAPLTQQQWRRADGECTKLDGKKQASEDVAPDDQQELRMRWLMQSVNNALAKGAPPFALDCANTGGNCATLVSQSLSSSAQTLDCRDKDGVCEIFDDKNLRQVKIAAGPGSNPIISAVRLEMRPVVTAAPDRSTD